MRPLSDITPLQVEVLEIVWKGNGTTAAQVRASLASAPELSRTTVATVLARMEKYGWLKSERVGRGFSYRATVSRFSVQQSQVRRLIRALFPEDVPSLLAHALRESEWADEDLHRIEELVEHHRQRRTGRES